MKNAFITGVAGNDRVNLSEFLLNKNFQLDHTVKQSNMIDQSQTVQ